MINTTPLFDTKLYNAMLSTDIANPFFQFVGGKRRLTSWICNHFPTHQIPHYYEPFVGGGAVFWYMRKRNRANHYTISDISPQIICNYISLRDHYSDFTDLYREVVYKHTRENFYQHVKRIKELYERNEFTVETAALDVYLKRFSLYSKNGTPINTVRKPVVNEDMLFVCHTLLQDVNILLCDYKAVCPNNFDVIYCDPPYVNTAQQMYYDNLELSSWKDEENIQLANQCVAWVKQGARVYISNYVNVDKSLEENSLISNLNNFRVKKKLFNHKLGTMPKDKKVIEILLVSERGGEHE